MATESDLRDLLRDPDPKGRGAIDLDAVLSRARRRRRPKVIVAQALGSVAAVGVLVTGVVATLPQAQPASLLTAEDSAGGAGDEYASVPESADAPGSADESSLRMSAEVCAAPYAVPVTADGWSLEIAPVAAEAGSATLDVPVTLSNTGATTAAGAVSAPRIVLTQGGVVVGYSPAVDASAIPLSLDAGGRAEFRANVEPFACDPAVPEATPETLELLPPGDYEMRPVIVLTVGDGVPITVVGNPQPLSIR